MVLGLTGKYCSGKSLVASKLAELGFQVIDVDRLGHEALQRELPRVVERFGRGVLGPDGSIDRRALGRLVFSDRRARSDLERILHPLMTAEVERLLDEARRRDENPRVAINAALLFPMGLDRLCDLVLWVHAPWPLRLLRAMRRDRLGPGAALRRMAAQRGLSLHRGSGRVDTLAVRNTAGRDRLFAAVERVLRARGVL